MATIVQITNFFTEQTEPVSHHFILQHQKLLPLHTQLTSISTALPILSVHFLISLGDSVYRISVTG